MKRGLARRTQQGQAIAELAVAISVVLILLAGLIDLAPALVNAGELSQAVREGVDYGHMNAADTTGIRTRVRNAAPRLTLADANIVVACHVGTSSTVRACSTVAIGDTITVSATTAYVPTINLIATVIGGSISLSLLRNISNLLIETPGARWRD